MAVRVAVCSVLTIRSSSSRIVALLLEAQYFIVQVSVIFGLFSSLSLAMGANTSHTHPNPGFALTIRTSSC